jgi:chromosome segregation ATPase
MESRLDSANEFYGFCKQLRALASTDAAEHLNNLITERNGLRDEVQKLEVAIKVDAGLLSDETSKLKKQTEKIKKFQEDLEKTNRQLKEQKEYRDDIAKKLEDKEKTIQDGEKSIQALQNSLTRTGQTVSTLKDQIKILKKDKQESADRADGHAADLGKIHNELKVTKAELEEVQSLFFHLVELRDDIR